MKIRTLLIDAEWLIKRNFHALKVEDAYKKRCGGSYGFLINLSRVLKDVIPDRVIVAWDGFQSGKYRYDLYKPYKAGRKGKWTKERDVLSKRIENAEDQAELDLFIQKYYVKNMMEELNVRQCEADYIEADDFIAGYILLSKSLGSDEEIYVFSRDKDYRQMVDEGVVLISPDFNTPITVDNFQEKIGHTRDNELLFKCFEGDSSDSIEGVKGVTVNTLQKYIPDIKERKYTFKEIVSECETLKGEKKYKNNKSLDKIINAGEILYRNAKLMNLEKPFLNDEANEIINEMKFLPLSLEGSLDKVMKLLQDDGYIRLMRQNRVNVSDFFAPFHRLRNREEAYNEFYLKNNS